MLSEYARAMGAEFSGADVEVTGISTDSRSTTNQMYFALKGERFDGHDFLESAIGNGALATVTQTDASGADREVPNLSVGNTLTALGDAARLYRATYSGVLVGLTGSSGKTTTKNMLSSVLSVAGATHATPENFNNEIGVPKTLFGLNSAHEFAVVEMGARHVHDIDYLASIAQPTVGLVLNAGTAHLGEFGSLENIVKTKGELYKHIAEDGIAVMNLDDPAHQQWMCEVPASVRVIGFAIENDQAYISAEALVLADENSEFSLRIGNEFVEINLPVAGRHQVSNALAAAACAHAAGLSLSMIKQGLECFEAGERRAMTHTLANGVRVLDDSYNANPASMLAALEVLSLSERKTIAVLGDMAELGEQVEQFHQQLGQQASKLGITRLFAFGQYAGTTASGFGEGAQAFATKESLLTALRRSLTGDEMILIKGSRVCEMETLLESLLESVH